MDGIELIKKRILETIGKVYPKNVVRFATDPEAYDIISIELFDIPDAQCRDVKKFLWKVIEENSPDNPCSFVPAVYSHSKTFEFYSDYCINPSSVVIEKCADYNDPLPESIMTILVSAEGNCSTVNQDAPTFDDHFATQPETQQLIGQLDIMKEDDTDVCYGLAA